MKVKKKYSFTNKRTIWRLLPSGDKLLIEERDEKNKQVYFSCIKIESGKKILNDFQLDEKFWVGIEEFENDMIFFHGFHKPDMPGHIGITVYSLNKKNILWSRKDLIFLFLYKEKLFAFRQKFEARELFLLDAETGNILEEYGEEFEEINRLREKSLDEQYEKYKNYFFPEAYVPGKLTPEAEKTIEDKKNVEVISGSIDLISNKNLLFLSYHTVDNEGKLENNFNVVDIDTGKIILEVLLNQGITSYIPDSFFVKDDLLLLLKNKNELIVYSLE